MSTQRAWYFDARACIGCKACELACKDAHDLPVGIRWRRVWDYGGGSWVEEDGFLVPDTVFSYHVSASCMHCLEPACREACPAGAITKRDDGLVLIDPHACIADRACEQACPYHAPQFDEKHRVMTKCTLCADLLAQGEQPACVAICPQRCLAIGDLETLRSQFGLESAIDPLPDASITRPALVITPHRASRKSGTGTGKVLTRVEEQN